MCVAQFAFVERFASKSHSHTKEKIFKKEKWAFPAKNGMTEKKE